MLRHSEDRLPVIFISLGLVLSLLPFLFNSEVVLLLAAIGLIPRAVAPLHQHCHGHKSIFQNKFYNDAYNIILMFAGGYTTAMWKIHHNISHHRDYLDPVADYEGNDRFGEDIPFKRVVFTFLGDAMTTLDCFQILKKKNLLKSELRRNLERQLLLQLIIYSLLFLANWKLFLIFVYLPNKIFRCSVFWFSFAQHEHMPKKDVFSSSKTSFFPSKYLFNVGFHTAHHHRPALHWSKLEEHTYKILNKIPLECLEGSPKHIEEDKREEPSLEKMDKCI